MLHPVPGDVLVASLTLMLTACVHAGCLCFRNREGRFSNVKNESGLLLEFHFYMDSIEYEVYCQGGVTHTDVVVLSQCMYSPTLPLQ